MAGMHRLLLGTAVIIAVTSSLGVSDRTSSPAEDLLGTWQEVSIKNMKTGAVDTVRNHRINWSSYTRSHIFYAAIGRERQRPDPAEFGKMTDAEKMKIRY